MGVGVNIGSYYLSMFTKLEQLMCYCMLYFFVYFIDIWDSEHFIIYIYIYIYIWLYIYIYIYIYI